MAVLREVTWRNRPLLTVTDAPPTPPPGEIHWRWSAVGRTHHHHKGRSFTYTLRDVRQAGGIHCFVNVSLSYYPDGGQQFRISYAEYREDDPDWQNFTNNFIFGFGRAYDEASPRGGGTFILEWLRYHAVDSHTRTYQQAGYCLIYTALQDHRTLSDAEIIRAYLETRR